MSAPIDNNDCKPQLQQEIIAVDNNNTNNNSNDNNNYRHDKSNSIVIDIPPNSYLEKKNKEENKSAISKVSKTSKVSSTNKNNFLRIDTCCGTIELSSVKIVSLIGIFLTTVAFLTLSGVILATRILQRGQNGIDIAVDRGEIRTMRERLTAATFLALYSDTPLEYITLHNETSVTYLKTIEKLVVEFPEGFSNGWLNKYSSNNTSIIGIERAALTLISEGKRNEALSLINITNYFTLFNSFNNDLNEVLDLALSKERSKEEDLLAITVVGLIVIAIGLIILFPLMIGIFIFAINRDQLNLKKIKQANSVLLMDTMNNDKLRELFKKHCEKELSVENFKFLEKVTIYKRFCEQSFTIQEKLYGSDHSTSSDTTTSNNNNNNNHNNQDNTNNSNNNNNKKQQVTEQDLRKIENKKYETAFDIYTDFLDINGGNAVNISKLFIEEVKKQLDNFNTGHNEILPEVLFDNAAREISIVMLDTHQRFKASLAFQKEMKIHKLQTKKVKL